MNSESGVNRELLLDFIDESTEGLDVVDARLIDLESEPDNIDIINEVFRPVHSLKGNAAYFGLMRVKELAHSIENVLDAIRYKRIRMTKRVIDVLLPGIDRLKQMLMSIRNDDAECGNPDEIAALVKTIQGVLSENGDDAEKSAVVEMLKGKIGQIAGLAPEAVPGHVAELMALVNKLSAPGKTQDRIAATPQNQVRDDSLKSLYDKLGRPIDGKADDNYVNEIRILLERAAEETDGKEVKALIHEMTDEIDIFTATDVGFDELLRESLVEKLNTFTENIPVDNTAGKGSQTTETASRKKDGNGGVQKEKTMRVSEKSIDAFLEYVGELVVIEEMFTYLWKRLQDCGGQVTQEFRKTLDAFIALSTRLRTGILSIRKVEAGILLQKAPRIVRDIAAKAGKKISVSCSGYEVKIDKSYIDTLDAALTHMIRNAADHGIETTEKRIAAGKSEEGAISVAIGERENDIEIVVGDDGKGLNYEAIKKKAVSLGLIQENEVMTSEKTIALIFASGVSTSETVSEISGRGVGMDVVKRTVDAANGKIMIDSAEGTGCSFTIVLPKSISTQIFEGYIVRMFNGEVYVLPLMAVHEAFTATDGEITTVAGKGEMVLRHGRMLPVVRLEEKFEIDVTGKEENSEDRRTGRDGNTLVAMTVNKKMYAFKVDEIIGVQKVVEKPINGLEYNQKYFNGASMMGDGSVAMIVSAEGLANLVA